MKEPEYREGPEALESFKELAAAILQAPKQKIKPKKQTKTANSRKPKKSDSD